MMGKTRNIFNKFLVTHGWLAGRQRGFKSGRFYYYNGLRITFSKALDYVEKPGRGLDIGAGYGNEARELLKKGFAVIATEVNPDAISHLNKIARKNNHLTVSEVSLPEIPKGKFDFITCEMVLHFLDKKETFTALENIQKSTNQGGLNVVTSYVDSESIKEDIRMKGYCSYLLPSGELKKIYADWEILYYEEKVNAMGHPSARLIARKSR